MPSASDPAAYDTLVIGAGAAGMMCAIEAGKRGRRVALLEHNERVGQEDRHLRRRPLQLHQPRRRARRTTFRVSPDFCKSALARYTPWDFVALVEKHGVAYHEKKLGPAILR